MNTSPPPPSRLLQIPTQSKSPKRLRNAKNLSLNVPSFAQLSVAAAASSSFSTPKTATAAVFSINNPVPSAGLPTSVPTVTRKSNLHTIYSSPATSSFSQASQSYPHGANDNDTSLINYDLSHLSALSLKNSASSPLSKSRSSSVSTSPSPSLSSSSSTISCIPKQNQNLSLVIPIQNNQQHHSKKQIETSSSSSKPSSTTLSPPDSHSPYNKNSHTTERVVVVNTLPLSDPNDFVEPSYASYPNGPILICPPNIYLYSEPTKEEASQFDVIFNVAKEVKNPFLPSSSSNSYSSSSTPSPIPDCISSSPHPTTASTIPPRDYDTLSTHSSISSFSSSSCSSYSTNISSLSPTSSPDAILFPETRHETFPNIESTIIKNNHDCISSTTTNIIGNNNNNHITKDFDSSSSALSSASKNSLNYLPEQNVTKSTNNNNFNNNNININIGSSNAPSSTLMHKYDTSSSTTNNTLASSSSTKTTHTPPSSTQPEYFYVPWNHNSPIAQDLSYLTELLEERSKTVSTASASNTLATSTAIASDTTTHKKILVHCQCGVSRSASLLVAYVMKSRGWGVHQAYEWVKDKSPGISPNMSLIYQLVDWGRMLQQKDGDGEEDEREEEEGEYEEEDDDDDEEEDSSSSDTLNGSNNLLSVLAKEDGSGSISMYNMKKANSNSNNIHSNSNFNSNRIYANVDNNNNNNSYYNGYNGTKRIYTNVYADNNNTNNYNGKRSLSSDNRLSSFETKTKPRNENDDLTGLNSHFTRTSLL